MPSITVTEEYGIELPVLRGAYDWFFPEEPQQRQPATYVYNDVIVASAVEPQFRMFPWQYVDDTLVFKFLVEQWRLQRGATSSTTEMVLCSAYQSIIGMGEKAIPFILAELASELTDPDHWFWALQALTGANPVSEEDEGNLSKMARTWLQWAASQGYAW